MMPVSRIDRKSRGRGGGSVSAGEAGALDAREQEVRSEQLRPELVVHLPEHGDDGGIVARAALVHRLEQRQERRLDRARRATAFAVFGMGLATFPFGRRRPC